MINQRPFFLDLGPPAGRESGHEPQATSHATGATRPRSRLPRLGIYIPKLPSFTLLYFMLVVWRRSPFSILRVHAPPSQPLSYSTRSTCRAQASTFAPLRQHGGSSSGRNRHSSTSSRKFVRHHHRFATEDLD